MKTERLVKQLMAAGIQRNDARNFVKTYHAVKAAGKQRLFEELAAPELPPMEIKEVHPQLFRCEMAASRREYLSGTFDIDRYAKDRLKQDMARRIVESGAVRFTRREDLFFVTHRAELRILMPDEVAR